MTKHTYYTAVGHFRRKVDDQGHSRPVIIINQKEYGVDIQEMALWTALNWRLLEFPQIKEAYNQLERDCVIPIRRTMEDCLGRLVTRGLAASGCGETEFEAIYAPVGAGQRKDAGRHRYGTVPNAEARSTFHMGGVFGHFHP